MFKENVGNEIIYGFEIFKDIILNNNINKIEANYIYYFNILIDNINNITEFNNMLIIDAKNLEHAEFIKLFISYNNIIKYLNKNNCTDFFKLTLNEKVLLLIYKHNNFNIYNVYFLLKDINIDEKVKDLIFLYNDNK